ncbi:MAG: DUF2520 domain-containing protein [Tannerellaceae bacterium]|jgi:predicted short-subunit dehydrogenase-like oxidoreductase (DUF2520 family)|nr:DUF2520 domain-containing protein [Tannerellaceae bacterium]
MKIVFIGAGNLASGMSEEMQRAGMTIGQIYSRTRAHAESLARRINCRWTSNLHEVITDADLYVFAVTDTALPQVIARMKPNGGLWVHTAGSLPAELFERYTSRYGVFYPLQTFTRGLRVCLDKTPIFLEAKWKEDYKMLRRIAVALSDNVRETDWEQRKRIHLSAVFACNFTNHMYALAARIMEEQGLPYDLLLPLIEETAAKVNVLTPAEAQTGPAVRFDRNIMDKQIAMLEEQPAMQTIYKLLSQNIYKEKIMNKEIAD